jgi:hypothetical protein
MSAAVGSRMGAASMSEVKPPRAGHQRLTLVHFSAQLEPCLTQENPLHTLKIP